MANRGGPGRGDFGGGRGRGDGGRGGRGGGPGAGGNLPSLEAGEQAMVAQLRALKLTASPQPKGQGELVKRPNFGAAGKTIRVLTNYFTLECGAKVAHHWDVAISRVKTTADGEEMVGLTDPERGGKSAASIEVFAACRTQHNWPLEVVFDGNHNAYSPNRAALPQHESTFDVTLPPLPGRDRVRKFQVVTKWVAEHNFAAITDYCKGLNPNETPRDALQALDIALRHGVSVIPTCVSIGRGIYYNDPNLNSPLGGGFEAWIGYTQALKTCQFGLALTIDTAATAFLESKDLVLVMASSLNARGGPREMITKGVRNEETRRLRSALRNVKVNSTYGKSAGREWTIKSVSDKPANQEKLKGQDLTVAQYFDQTYGIKLKAPTLPCMEMAGRGSLKDKKISIPPELLVVKAGQRRVKLDPEQTAGMIKVAAISPKEKVKQIQDSIPELRLDTDPVVEAFGISISKKLLDVDARILPTPILHYEYPAAVDVGNQGAWNLRDVKFYKGCELRSFAVVSFARQAEVQLQGPSSLDEFMRDLLKMLDTTGVKVNRKAPCPVHYATSQLNVHDNMAEANKLACQAFGAEAQLIFVLLPTPSPQLYGEVKRASDGAMGIPSQCFVMKKAGVGANNVCKGRSQYCANLAMKINHKVGGCNVILAGATPKVIPVIGSKPFMVFGADVTHPTTRSEFEPSVAAVVGSTDRTLGRFASRVSVQAGRQETITAMRQMAKELLLEFYQANGGKKPEAIVFFRDGVSEGQFKQVLEAEYTALRQACKDLEGDSDYTPPITFVVVQKRHNTRLFPADGEHQDRSGNVLPGTVVDKGITSPYEFDFFLNSHAGLQGTSRPAHYVVLVDENGFGADGMQLLSYWLCYLFCRCTRSVSIASPAYYAHRAAFRGRLMVDYSDTSSESSGGTNQGFASTIPISNKLGRVMYYI